MGREIRWEARVDWKKKRPFAVGTAVSRRSTGSDNQESGHSWREGSRGGARGEESTAFTCSWAPQGLRFCGNPEVKGQVFRCWKFFRVDRKCPLSPETNRVVVKQSDIECLSALWVCVFLMHMCGLSLNMCASGCVVFGYIIVGSSCTCLCDFMWFIITDLCICVPILVLCHTPPPLAFLNLEMVGYWSPRPPDVPFLQRTPKPKPVWKKLPRMHCRC